VPKANKTKTRHVYGERWEKGAVSALPPRVSCQSGKIHPYRSANLVFVLFWQILRIT